MQLVPVNLNAPLSKGGPPTHDPGCGCNGKDGKGKPHARRGGDVSQSNRASSGAGAGNLAVVGQDIDQTGNGNGSQTAINKVDQDANARAKTVQLLPINANLPASSRVHAGTPRGARGPGLRLRRHGAEGRRSLAGRR